MNLLARIRTGIRTKQGRRGRGVFAAFAVVWLNMLLQPCAMALSAEHAGDCPHCPPAQMHAPGHHDGAHGDRQPVPADLPPHPSQAADCGSVDDVNRDARYDARLKAGDPSGAASFFIRSAAFPEPLAPDGGLRSRAADYFLSAAPAAPLNVLYCVYLD